MSAGDWHHRNYVRSLTSHADLTRVAYRTDIEAFMGWSNRHGADGPSSIDRSTVRAFLGYMADRRYASTTVARRVAGCRSYFRWAVRRELATTNPFASVSLPRRARLPRVLEDWELEAMFADVAATIGTGPWGLQDAAVIEVLYAAGVRVSELCGLDVDDVDLDAGVVWVWGKGGRQRLAVIGGPAVDALRAWLEEGRPQVARPELPTGAVFLGGWADRLGTRGVRRIVDRHAPRGAHPHQVRHTTATHLLEGGMDLRALQEQLGHANLDSTARYAQVRPEYLRSVVHATHPRARR